VLLLTVVIAVVNFAAGYVVAIYLGPFQWRLVVPRNRVTLRLAGALTALGRIASRPKPAPADLHAK
jgi:hypothetical protein